MTQETVSEYKRFTSTSSTVSTPLSLFLSAMSRKRDKPYSHTTTRHQPYTYSKPKRQRPTSSSTSLSLQSPTPLDIPQQKPTPPPALLIIGLPTNSSVLDLKARFEIYGSISRIRIDHDGVGFVSFRCRDSAQSAVSASLDPSFGISVGSHPVQVMWADEMNRHESDDRQIQRTNSTSSKLLKGSPPLSKHRRGNRLSSAIVNPNTSSSSVLDPPIKPREIIAYDDLL